MDILVDKTTHTIAVIGALAIALMATSSQGRGHTVGAS